MMLDRATEYLRAVDQRLPGFVELLYVTGSAALGAFVPGASDVDTVIVTSRTPTDSDLVALAAVHAGMVGRPHFDGVYLTREAFSQQPADERIAPYIVDGVFHTGEPCGELNPVLWLTLHRYGLPVRGPAVAELNLRPDPDALRRWNLDNLTAYWQPLGARASTVGAERAPDASVDADVVVWIALGPARLHYTLATQDVISKARAGGLPGGDLPGLCLAGRPVGAAAVRRAGRVRGRRPAHGGRDGRGRGGRRVAALGLDRAAG